MTFYTPHRISELDFEDDVPTNNDISWVRYKKLKEISSDNVLLKYTFSGNWGMNGSVLTRGPGMYMLKVEAKERDRNDDGLVDEQKIGSYTKEARMFFKVVNEFEEDPDTLFLLVNNTDKDPYLQRYAMRGSITGYTLPSTAIRYYEDVLDNYQYTRGKASIDISSKKISEDDPDSSFWKHRVFVGDKIRINNEEGVLSPWLRVVSKETDDSSSVTSLTVDGNVSLFTGDKTGMDYVVARAYTPGYSEVYYSYNGFSEGPPQFVASANLFIPKNQLQSGGQLVVIIKKGDYFKFLDSRDFVEIDSVSISPNVNADDNWVVTLELVEPISHDSLWHYHSHAIFMNGDGNLQYPDKPNPEMESRIRNTTSGKISGSYAIYPKNGDAPNRLYKTWNVHNYNTSNREGQGVHGDLTTGILESYSVGDESNRHHKVVIFANDASYDGGVSINSQFTRDRDNDGTAGTEVHIGDPSYFTSEKDARLFSNFLGAGGRLLTGGQFDRVDGDSSFYQLLGLESSEAPASSVPTSVIRVDNDPISNAFNAGASINIGAREGANDTIDAEALNTNVDPKGLMLQGGLALPMLEYTGIGASANSSIAATRVSGGTDDKIHAAVYLGFDFATMSQSGIKSELTDKTDSNDTEAGRNLLLKKSIDWLRDPSLTPKDRRAELTYIAEDIDGNTTIIALGNGGAIVNDSLHSENNLSSGVGPAMELTFVASGGKLYSNNPYIWSGVGLGIRRDAQVSDNEDMHRVIVTTGTDINDVYELVLDAPDGSRTIVEIQVRKQEMTCTVLPLENEVINQSTVFSAGKEVTLYTFGGLGKGSFEYSISSISEPWIRGVLEKKADGTAIYKLPQWPEDEKQTTVVNFLVQSFDQYDNLFDETDASLTIYPPLKLDISEEELVDGTGGLIIASPKGGYSSGYDFTSSPADLVTLSLDEESDDAQVSMAPSPVLSNDLKSPTTVTITASDMTFVNESALRNIKLFPGPSLDYKVSTASSGFFDLQENSSFGDLSGNALTLSLMGGNGTMTVELLEVSEGFKTTKDAYNGELIVTNSDNVITSGENITEGQSLELNNLDGAYISIFPGEIPGSITLRTSSKGSSNTFVINFDTSIKVEHTKADGTATDEVIGDSQTVYLRARNDDQLTAKNSMMSIGVREQVGLIEWTYSGVTGGFVSSANYISYQSSTNINVGEPIFSANMIQHSPSDNVYFVAPRTTGAATLTATIGAGDDQLTKTINFQFTATDPMNWVQHPDSEDATSLNPLQPVTFEFSQGEGPFSVSLQGFGAEVTVSSGQLNGSSIVIASGSQQMFTLNPNGSESTGTVKVTDNSGLTLVSSVLTFKSDPGSSPSPNPGLPPGPSYSGTPNTTASPSAGGGGGGCLLR